MKIPGKLDIENLKNICETSDTEICHMGQVQEKIMKVLLVNNFYYNRGGDCTYLFSVKRLLEENKHKVCVFSMHHPQNFESEYSEYFVSYINYTEEIKSKNLLSGLKVLFRTIYSLESRKKLESLIEKERPDIAHIQNIHHHITPSILSVLKKLKIPIVWTLHDYTLICPNTSFLCQGQICERCKKVRYFWPPIVKCKKNSFVASAMAAIENTMHRIMGVYDLVDVFITPSEFLKNKLIEYGFKKEKILCLNNFIDIDSSYKNEDKEGTGNYYLYVGRISEEKGIRTLLDAAIAEDKIALKIVGDGPLREEMVFYAKSKDKNSTIDFLGHKSHKEVIELLKNCKFVVVPSEWYENFPYSILEAFACGKSVIGSRIGGIPELVKEEVTGLTFEPGNLVELRSKIEYYMNNPGKVQEMGKNARLFVKKELNAEGHYRRLMEIYKQVTR